MKKLGVFSNLLMNSLAENLNGINHHSGICPVAGAFAAGRCQRFQVVR
jgi:hypothetical protein